MPDPELTIQWMQANNHADVCDLERLVYRRTADDPSDLPRTLAERGTAGLVAACDGRLVGYLIFRLDAARRQLGLADLVVHPAYRRRGIARRLLSVVLERVRHVAGLQVVAAVEESLLPAQLFLRAMGFRCHGIARGAVAGEDAYLFRYQPPV